MRATFYEELLNQKRRLRRIKKEGIRKKTSAKWKRQRS